MGYTYTTQRQIRKAFWENDCFYTKEELERNFIAVFDDTCDMLMHIDGVL